MKNVSTMIPVRGISVWGWQYTSTSMGSTQTPAMLVHAILVEGTPVMELPVSQHKYFSQYDEGQY